MNALRDVATMTARERIAEIGQILASGFLRVLARRQCDEKALGGSGPQTADVPERGRAVNDKSKTGVA